MMTRYYSPQTLKDCPIETPMKIKMNIPKYNTDKVRLSAIIIVTEEVQAEVDFVIESNQCKMDMKTCQKENSLNVAGMCDMFKAKNTIYSSIFDSIEPPLRCPIKPGNYTLRESILDLSPIRLIPLDGFVYVTTFRLVSGPKGTRSKKVALCLNTETKIFKTNKVLKN